MTLSFGRFLVFFTFFLQNLFPFGILDSMKAKIHLYVNRRSVLTWLMALCMVVSAVARIGILGVKGSEDSRFLWSQIVLPVTATILYMLIALLDGTERFYKTAIPVWMMAIYSGIWIHDNTESTLLTWLFWIALFFAAFLYTEITAGNKGYAPMFLLPVVGAPLAYLLYVYRTALLTYQPKDLLPLLPNALALLGVLLQIFALKVHTDGAFHPTWGDRVDGRRLRSQPPLDQVSPFLMVHRNESSNLFSDSFEITQIDRYIRQKRREGLTNFGIMHVLLAVYCRCICRYPALNRFLSGQRVYSRGEDIQFCLTVKTQMTTKAPDSVVKLHLSPRDTAADVYRKLQAAVEEAKNESSDSGLDSVAWLFTLIPRVLLKFVVWLLKLLDYFGMLPKFLLELSPFHGSLFMTSMGSLGIPPVYHHLYNFGNIPAFVSFGMKRRATEVQEDGTVVQRKYVDARFTVDERIVDGFYYAAFFKHYKRILAHPEILDKVPEEVLPDID